MPVNYKKALTLFPTVDCEDVFKGLVDFFDFDLLDLILELPELNTDE